MNSKTGTTRVVVQLRWRMSAEPEDGDDDASWDVRWTRIASPLLERAAALGGRVIGWGDQHLVVDFAWDGLYDAIDYLVDAPLFPELSGGIAHGPLNVVSDAGRVAVATGDAIRLAARLSELAHPGEILVSPALVEECEGRLGSAGKVGPRPGRPEVDALILDPERPLRETEPPEMPTLEFVAPRIPRDDELGNRESQVERIAHVTEAVQRESGSLFPQLSRALEEGDRQSLEELTDSVRRTHSPEAAERLSAIAELAHGRSGEALRRLRAAKEEGAPEDLSARCRASLALAIALAAAGRSQDAILETLEAVAHARAGSDSRGERASVRFMAQLARSLDDDESARAWDELCSNGRLH